MGLNLAYCIDSNYLRRYYLRLYNPIAMRKYTTKKVNFNCQAIKLHPINTAVLVAFAIGSVFTALNSIGVISWSWMMTSTPFIFCLMGLVDDGKS